VASATSSPFLMGWLQKESGNRFIGSVVCAPNFALHSTLLPSISRQKRWFVLQPDRLDYFRNKRVCTPISPDG